MSVDRPVRPPDLPAKSIAQAARMQDVARSAGVSLVTVSRAVNQPDKVAPATLEAVRSAIRRLQFVPNLTAGSLASRRSKIIAVIVPTIANSIFADTVEGMSQLLAVAGYQLLLGQSNYDLTEEARLIETFLGRRVDGLVLTGVDHLKAVRSRLQAAGLPVIETWDTTTRPIDQLVGFSNRQAGAAAAHYLIQKGHRHLAYIGGAEARSARRLEGFRDATRLAGLPEVIAADLPVPSMIRDAGEAFVALRAQQPGLQAVFCANDMLAAGVLFECQRRGWNVPGQLAIMGFADLPIAAATEPSLTSVQVHSREIGARAARLMLDRLDGQGTVQATLDLGFKIIARGSA